MMFRKKGMCIFLSAILAFCMIPVGVFATGAAQDNKLILGEKEYDPVSSSRLSTSLVGGVQATVQTGSVNYLVSNQSDSPDWDQTPGTGGVQGYTYVGVYVDIPQGAATLKMNDAGNPAQVAQVSDIFLQNGKFQQWFPVAYKQGDEHFLFYGGREYTLIMEWYDSADQLIKSEYIKVSRTLADPVAKVGNYTYETLSAAVDAVVNSPTKTGTVSLLKNATGSGIGLFASKGAAGVNLTIDFGGFTYTCADPAVGSVGTQSQGFHLEKDNTVTLKNGVINVDQNSIKTKMLIQNYSELTLLDLDLHGGAITENILSCNYGHTTLNNVNMDSTHTSPVAIDVMHWHGTAYEGQAPIVSISNSTSNHIYGSIDVYCYGTDSQNCTQKAALHIGGGTFSADPTPYLTQGLVTVQKNNAYLVHSHASLVKTQEKAATCTQPGNLTYWYCDVCDLYFVDQNATTSLPLDQMKTPALGHSYDNCVCTICGDTIESQAPTIDPGKPSDNVQVGVDQTNTQAISAETATIINQILKGESTTGVSPQVSQQIIAAINAGQTITTQVVFDTQVAPTQAQTALFENTMGKNDTIAQVFDLSLLLKTNTGNLGTIDQLSKPMTFQIAIPSELIQKNRSFFIIRIHNGTAQKLPVLPSSGTDFHASNTGSFQTDLFSTYALGYTDNVVSKSPETKDNQNMFPWVALLLISGAALAGTAHYNKKRKV